MLTLSQSSTIIGRYFTTELEKQDEGIGLKFKIGRSIVRGYLFILNEFKSPFQEIKMQLW